MKLGIVQEDVFVGNESDINIEFSLNIFWNLGIILEICAYHVSPACKIHRHPIILSIEMDAYPLQEIVDDRMSETRPFLDRRSARSIRACNIVHLCHGSKMERDKYPVIPYSHSLLLLSRMIDISRKYIATKKIIATNKKKKYDHAIIVHPAAGIKYLSRNRKPIELVRFANFSIHASTDLDKLISKFSHRIHHHFS